MRIYRSHGSISYVRSSTLKKLLGLSAQFKWYQVRVTKHLKKAPYTNYKSVRKGLLQRVIIVK